MDLIIEIIPAWQFYGFAFIFGALWGSFANVVIIRLPLEMSVVKPASHCFHCKTPVRFYDNIPILSWFILGGRCRHCKTRFSPRYALIELAMALLSVGVLKMTLLSEPGPATFQQGAAEYFIWFAFIWAVITAGLIDLEHYFLPDEITLPGIAIGLLANSFVIRHFHDIGWLEPLLAAICAYALLRLLFIDGYKLLTGRAGMGEGDAKLLALFGAFFGVEGVLFALFAGAVQGLFIGIGMVLLRREKKGLASEPIFEEELDENGEPQFEQDARLRKARIPFGPFLVLGAVEYFFFGKSVFASYESGLQYFLSNFL